MQGSRVDNHKSPELTDLAFGSSRKIQPKAKIQAAKKSPAAEPAGFSSAVAKAIQHRKMAPAKTKPATVQPKPREPLHEHSAERDYPETRSARTSPPASSKTGGIHSHPTGTGHAKSDRTHADAEQADKPGEKTPSPQISPLASRKMDNRKPASEADDARNEEECPIENPSDARETQDPTAISEWDSALAMVVEDPDADTDENDIPWENAPPEPSGTGERDLSLAVIPTEDETDASPAFLPAANPVLGRANPVPLQTAQNQELIQEGDGEEETSILLNEKTVSLPADGKAPAGEGKYGAIAAVDGDEKISAVRDGGDLAVRFDGSAKNPAATSRLPDGKPRLENQDGEIAASAQAPAERPLAFPSGPMAMEGKNRPGTHPDALRLFHTHIRPGEEIEVEVAPMAKTEKTDVPAAGLRPAGQGMTADTSPGQSGLANDQNPQQGRQEFGLGHHFGDRLQNTAGDAPSGTAFSSQLASSSGRPEGMMEARLQEINALLRREIDARTATLIQKGSEEIHMQLMPEHLGRIRVALAMKDGSVNAHIQVQSEAARQSVDQGLQQLREGLALHGLKIENLSVSVEDRHAGLFNPDGNDGRGFFRERHSGSRENGAPAHSGDDMDEIRSIRYLGYNTMETIG